MTVHDGLFIDGAWRDGAHTHPVHDPSDGSLIAEVAVAGDEDLDDAVDAAADAFPRHWARRGSLAACCPRTCITGIPLRPTEPTRTRARQPPRGRRRPGLGERGETPNLAKTRVFSDEPV